MLVAAGVRLSGAPMLQLGAASAAVVERNCWQQPGALRNMLIGEGSERDGSNRMQALKAALPNGYEHPGAWSLAQKGGGLASHHLIEGSGDLTPYLLMGRALDASLTGSGDISSATLALVVSMSAALSGSGALSGSMSGAVQMAASLAGSGDITAALGAIIGMTATLSGSGTLDGSNLTGIAGMEASILSYGELTPEGIRDAVWNAIAASFNTAGTMGALMNGGAAGGLTTEQATQLLEIFQRLGLDADKPLTQTATQISTPDWTLDVTESGGGTTVVVERQP